MESGAASPRVLVVDDDPDVLASLERGLRLSGFEVSTAVDGAEALRSATETRPDAIVLDINMPIMGGLEAAEQILQLAPGTRIIFLSQDDSEDMIEAAMAKGARAYVVKTHSGTDLVKAVDAVVAGKKFVSRRDRNGD